jgi:ABC-type uncharacterized transport system permease subunit
VTLVGKLSTVTIKDNVAVVVNVILADISKLVNFIMMVTLAQADRRDKSNGPFSQLFCNACLTS